MAADDANLNALWSRAIAEELARGGARWAVLCPGSRNSPLLFALAKQPELACLSHTDERSAGFVALGLARAGGAPAVVCVTSGSALANLLPCVAEAQAASIPLIVLAADRPWELVGVGAPQTMPQPGIFGAHVVDELALGAPTLQDQVLRALRARVSRLVQLARGPVFINVPLRDPLPPIPDAAFAREMAHDERRSLSATALHGRTDAWPYTLAVSDPPAPSDAATDGSSLSLLDWLRPQLRGLIVVGAGASPRLCAGAEAMARASGFPLIADAPTALRTDASGALACADALAGRDLGGLGAPELVIQVGPLPLARQLSDYLAHAGQSCAWLSLEERSNRDALACAWATVRDPGPQAFAAIGAACAPGDARWAAAWRAADLAASAALSTHLRDAPWSEVAAAHDACVHGGFGWLHLASSLAVRHGNLHCQRRAEPRRVFANRGLNGIDGTIGTFLGEAMVQETRGLLLIGDLATIHDLPALAAAAQAPRAPATLVVLDNGGGGIFDFLPVSRVAGWKQWVRTPHAVDLVGCAAAFALRAERVASRAALGQALDAAAAAGTCSLIVCAVPDSCVDAYRALVAAMAQAAQQAVNAVMRSP